MSTMLADQSVRVVNTSTEPFVGKVSPTHKVTIPPGASRHVPWPWACYWVGNPDLVGRDRELRIDQVLMMYGVYTGMAELNDRSKLPKLEVYNDLTEQRIPMLLDDMMGHGQSSLIEVSLPSTPDAQATAQASRMAALEAANAELLELVKGMVGNGPTSPQPFDGGAVASVPAAMARLAGDPADSTTDLDTPEAVAAAAARSTPVEVKADAPRTQRAPR